MLEAAGLAEVEERAYRLLVRAGEADVRDLAEELGITPDAATTALSAMLDKGLAREVVESRFAPVAPEVALGPRLVRQQETIDWARQAVEQLAEEYRSSLRRRDADRLIEVLPSRAALREQVRHLQDSAREEVMYFCRAGHVVMPSTDNTEELEALGRGVDYRVIYERALLEEPGMVANVAFGIKLGERARAVRVLPVRMMIADRSTALLPLVQHAGRATEPTAALVRGSSLLEALIGLFETQWERATPIRFLEDGQVTDGAPTCPLDADELYLLSLLVAGVPDKSIATQLGLSQRTVQRRVYHLMRLAGAQTRMQLAWHAARERWL
ncbi:TrmB family transcriptional regulator [Nonomuraea sp. K274]|uniref:TrmB family transcriptional regulator n=1 Tax=Nonomuraea cypriaca TaxID=1187855 RepID=A0A931A7H7_9ACTN|nr:LuxR family transcriptional regulator [Nonomuraea cypriaca]MBF8184844.1 TrmB family transcriptional regulator [Nonomuraea cypriaca]